MDFLAPPSPFDPPSLLYTFLSAPVKLLLRNFYWVFTTLRCSPKAGAFPIRIVCISDTHCQSPTEIPEGDILIHAGDLTNAGTPAEIQVQIDWLESLPHKHKIAIAGNHDTFLDPRSRKTLPSSDLPPQVSPPNWGKLHYIQHSTLTLTLPTHNNRKLRIYGAPQIPACGGPEFAFQYPRGTDAWTDTIPNDIDILVTHTPPKYHRDLPAALGCEHLLSEIWRVKPLLHVFGHVHAGAGKELVYWDAAQRALERGMARKDGFFRNLLDVTLWTSVVKVIIWGTVGVLWSRVWGGEEYRGWMVNAALMLNNTGKVVNRPQIIEI